MNETCLIATLSGSDSRVELVEEMRPCNPLAVVGHGILNDMAHEIQEFIQHEYPNKVQSSKIANYFTKYFSEKNSKSEVISIIHAIIERLVWDTTSRDNDDYQGMWMEILYLESTFLLMDNLSFSEEDCLLFIDALSKVLFTGLYPTGDAKSTWYYLPYIPYDVIISVLEKYLFWHPISGNIQTKMLLIADCLESQNMPVCSAESRRIRHIIDISNKFGPFNFSGRTFIHELIDDEEIFNWALAWFNKTNIDKNQYRRLKKITDHPVVKEFLGNSNALKVAYALITTDFIAAQAKWLEREINGQLNIRLTHISMGELYPVIPARIISLLFKKGMPLSAEQAGFIINCTTDIGYVSKYNVPYLNDMVNWLEKYKQNNEFMDTLNNSLSRLCQAMVYRGKVSDTKLMERIKIMKRDMKEIPLEQGSAWSDKVITDWLMMPEAEQTAWLDLFDRCTEIKSSVPTKKWRDNAGKIIDTIGRESFNKIIPGWLAWAGFNHQNKYLSDANAEAIAIINQMTEDELISAIDNTIYKEYKLSPGKNIFNFACVRLHKMYPSAEYRQRIKNFIQSKSPFEYQLTDNNSEILKGLIWCCSLFDNRELANALTALVVDAYRKLPGIGPRAVKIGNACIGALGEMVGMEGIRQMALLKTRVRFRTALKLIDKALEQAAARQGITRDELEEISVPVCGLTAVGEMRETLGDYTACLQVTDTGSTTLTWSKGGKPQKSIPAAVKADYPDDLKEIKAAAAELQKMLPAQKYRIESAYWQDKTWPYPLWRERYLDHPLAGTIARRLIWEFDGGDTVAEGIWQGDRLTGPQGDITTRLNDTTQVRLWHPIGHEPQEVLAWRQFIQDQEIRQPFKQAHREVYYLTDAERQTGVYSNRFAGHIVKQHQFNSLCAARSWKNSLKLLVDQDFPPAMLLLPRWGLRAEFWTDGAGDEYGQDTNETGTYYYLSTDQVRFFPLEARSEGGHTYSRGDARNDPSIPLEKIPLLVFSEVMRDVDLFVGVASVGNDPQWQDGGRDGRYADYWRSYSFGNLSETAQTRKAVLGNLIPRMKISARCQFLDKFLVVRGDIRTYKIHLGSGNILMEPDDRYLCIVARQHTSNSDKVFLPFEGDNMLSVILSKALLLAEDTRITDPAIVSQIKR